MQHTMEINRSLPGVECTCGLKKRHHRGKVLTKWVRAHEAKYGHVFVPPEDKLVTPMDK